MRDREIGHERKRIVGDAGSAGAVVPARRGAAARPDAQQGHCVHRAERDALGLRGLLPPRVCTQEEQVAASSRTFAASPTPLDKYIYLTALHDRNEALFYRLVIDHPDEMMPIVYTPTVGLACQKFGHIFQRPRGIFITAEDRGRIEEILRNWPHGTWRSSSSPTASASSVSATWAPAAWAFPSASSRSTPPAPASTPRCLPVMLDVGTNNPTLRDDPFYIGLRQTAPARRRLRRTGR